MESTRHLDVELPEEMAEAVEARVTSGVYASASEVVQVALHVLAESEQSVLDPALEVWLHSEIASRYDAARVREDSGFTLDRTEAALGEVRTRRNAAP